MFLKGIKRFFLDSILKFFYCTVFIMDYQKSLNFPRINSLFFKQGIFNSYMYLNIKKSGLTTFLFFFFFLQFLLSKPITRGIRLCPYPR